MPDAVIQASTACLTHIGIATVRIRLLDFIAAQGIRLEFKESIAPALGMSYGGKIAILPGQSEAEEFSTLVHELAHLCCVEDYVV